MHSLINLALMNWVSGLSLTTLGLAFFLFFLPNLWFISEYQNYVFLITHLNLNKMKEAFLRVTVKFKFTNFGRVSDYFKRYKYLWVKRVQWRGRICQIENRAFIIPSYIGIKVWYCMIYSWNQYSDHLKYHYSITS